MDMMSSVQLEALKEMVKTGTKKAADMLSEMLDTQIELEVPSLDTSKPGEDNDDNIRLTEWGGKLVSVELGFHGSFSGKSLLVFSEKDAAKLVTVLTDQEPGSDKQNSLMVETLSEVGNIVINGVMGSISNCLENLVDYSLPHYKEGESSALLKWNDLSDNATLILAEAAFKVQDIQVEGGIFIAFELDSLKNVFSEIDKYIANNFDRNSEKCRVV